MNKFTKTIIALTLAFAASTAAAADMNKENCNAQASVNIWDSTAGNSGVVGVKSTTKVRSTGVAR